MLTDAPGASGVRLFERRHPRARSGRMTSPFRPTSAGGNHRGSSSLKMSWLMGRRWTGSQFTAAIPVLNW